MTQRINHALRKLGDILVDCRVVTQDQVDQALGEQRRTGKLFGEALLDLGHISEDDLGWALSNQLDIPYIDLKADMVDLGAVSLLGPTLMRRYRLLPLVRVGDALTVVVADPTNAEALNEVEEVTGLTVQSSIASPRRINAVLEEVLGPERKDESGDHLFNEITRPYLGDDRNASDRPNPIGGIFSAALRDNVREIHLEPSGSLVRVRFRRGSKLEDQPPIQTIDFEAMILRLRGNPDDPLHAGEQVQSWHSVMEFTTGLLELSVTLLPAPGGTGMVLELRKGSQAPPSIDSMGLEPSETGLLRGLLGSHGLIVVTGPDPLARHTAILALAGAIDCAVRRVVAFGPGLSGTIEGITAIPTPGPDGRTEAVRRDLCNARFIDALLLDELTPGPELDRAVQSAACGKLIVASVAGPDALTTLATLTQGSACPTALSRGLLAVMEAVIATPGRPTATILPIGGDLAGLVERRVTRARLERAAAALRFHSLFSERGHSGRAIPSHPLRPEAGLEAA
jgi:type IV pilus assembly protein PilB